MHFGLKLTTMALLIVSVVHAEAQDAGAPPSASINPKFDQFVRSPDDRDAVNKFIASQIAGQGTKCTTASIRLQSVAVLQPAVFSTEGTRPTAGVWKETVQIDACGAAYTWNVLTIVRAGDGTLVRRLMLPGSTRCDPALQRDAALTVYTNVRTGVEKSCEAKDFLIKDTKFVAFDPATIPNAKAGRNAHAWTENWSIVACGREIMTHLTFTPDSSGTSIKVALDK
jgi:hypothetical protein